MAHKITTTPILRGYRTQCHVYLLSDGASGDITDYVILDPAALGIEPGTKGAIEMISHNFAGFQARIEFDSGLVDDNMIWVLPENSTGHVDFNPWGGLLDRSGLDGTGRIQLTTTGFGDAGSEGSILLMVRHG